jgi:hypothetical protein
MMSLGCPSCPLFGVCGGLHVEAHLFDCLSLCCGKLDKCWRVCPNKPRAFVAQNREVGGFDFDEAPRAPARPSNLGSDIAELIYHGSRRQALLRVPMVALRLADVVDYRRKRARFATRSEMCAALRIDFCLRHHFDRRRSRRSDRAVVVARSCSRRDYSLARPPRYRPRNDTELQPTARQSTPGRPACNEADRHYFLRVPTRRPRLRAPSEWPNNAGLRSVGGIHRDTPRDFDAGL